MKVRYPLSLVVMILAMFVTAATSVQYGSVNLYWLIAAVVLIGALRGVAHWERRHG